MMSIQISHALLRINRINGMTTRLATSTTTPILSTPIKLHGADELMKKTGEK